VSQAPLSWVWPRAYQPFSSEAFFWFLRRQQQRKARMARMRPTPTPTPIPMPSLAVLERPLEAGLSVRDSRVSSLSGDSGGLLLGSRGSSRRLGEEEASSGPA
jgi:hypothetical protein